jgi:AcrR family transcriptional regulator
VTTLAQKGLPLPASAPFEEGKREQIVSQAIRLFCEKGYEATSVREIVEAVGVSKPVLYYYFQNKHELFRYIVENSMNPFYETVLETCRRSDLDFWEKLKALFELHIEAAQEEPELVRFLHAIAFSNLYRETFDFQAYWVKTLQTLVEVFQEAQVEGALRKDRTALFFARNYMGLAYSEIRSLVYSPELLEKEPSSEEVVDFFRKGAQA